MTRPNFFRKIYCMNHSFLPRALALLFLGFGLLLPTSTLGGDSFWPKELRPGCMVNYRLHSIPLGETAPVRAECSILVLSISGGKMDLEFTLQGVGNRLSVATNGFDPAKILGAPATGQDMTAQTTDAQYKSAEMSAPIAASKTVWKGDATGAELVRSAEIPFGLASLRRGDFSLEVVSFSWGEK